MLIAGVDDAADRCGFATALVLFDNLPAWQAFKISYRGCMANLMPFLVFGLIGMVLCVVATRRRWGWSLFPLVPVLFATSYTSYRDVFGAEAAVRRKR